VGSKPIGLTAEGSRGVAASARWKSIDPLLMLREPSRGVHGASNSQAHIRPRHGDASSEHKVGA